MTENNQSLQFPSTPPNNAKWPWVKEAKPFPSKMPNGKAWPKISIVTPSYNQGKFIEETIRSVIVQNYPNLEFIIMDGGSTDESVEIIKKYEPWLTYWVSEKDKGQSDAVYRGFEKATGDIIAWINSDDYYLPNAFKHVAHTYIEEKADFIGGGIYYIQENGKIRQRVKGYTQDFNSLLCFGQYLAQPACFWSREAFFKVGGFDRTLRFSFDYDLFVRLTKQYKQKKLNKYVAVFREHSEAKSSTIWLEVGSKEGEKIRQMNGIDNFEKKKKKRILNKEKIRLLYYKCKSINNILINPKLIFALVKRSLLYFLTK